MIKRVFEYQNRFVATNNRNVLLTVRIGGMNARELVNVWARYHFDRIRRLTSVQCSLVVMSSTGAWKIILMG